MHVTIAGGGLAGVTLGAALHAKGASFEIIERAPEFRPVGAGIALMPLWGAMAMEDASELADEIAARPIADSLGAFVARRAPRIRWVQERTRAWVDRMRGGEATDPAAAYRADYAPLLADP